MSDTQKPSSVKYTDEFKRSAAKLAVDNDQSVSQTAKELGVKSNTLYGWVDKYYPDRHQSTQEKELTKDREISYLRKENTKLKQERDILKKAAAYFARETL